MPTESSHALVTFRSDARHKRFKDGSWRLIVDAGKDRMTGKRRQILRTVRAPNTRAGAQAADVAPARLVVEVTSG